MADYFTGQDWRDYPAGLSRGIIHHRQVDDFTDHHEEFLAARRLLAESGAPRFSAGILLDIFWDHVLASFWEEYGKPLGGQDLEPFCQKVNQAILVNRSHWSPVFCQVAPWLTGQNWLSGYRSIEGVRRSLEGLSRRLSKGAALADCHRLFLRHETALREGFRRFWPRVVEAARAAGEGLKVVEGSEDQPG